MSELKSKRCLPCEGGVEPLGSGRVDELLTELPGWSTDAGRREIRKDFAFDDYYRTMAFVNAVAWMAHHENHHPDLEVGYNHCLVRYTTHAVDGLSENDFICAAKVEGLLENAAPA